MKQLLIIVCFLKFFFLTCFSSTIKLPKAGGDVIGEIQKVITTGNEALFDLARKHDIGYLEIVDANPGINPKKTLKPGTQIIIPSQFVLPSGPRIGIVINLAELRLYYFHSDGQHVTTAPVGIGREGWNTPLGVTKIISKIKDPSWYPTDNVRKDAEKIGLIIPKVVLPGPENPLGKYAMRMGWQEYLIHGTNKPEGVGRRSSAGCIRMFPEDIEELFSIVQVGDRVTIINEPFKTGWLNNNLYIEAHIPLQEDTLIVKNLDLLVIKVFNKFGKEAIIHWSKAQLELIKQTGIPFKIGLRAKV